MILYSICVQYLSVSACNCLGLIHDSTCFSVERMILSIPPLSSRLSLSLSLSLPLTIVLFCLTFLVCNCFLVHSNLNCRACVWNQVWWRSFGKVLQSNDVLLFLLAFSLIVFEGVFNSLSCMQWFICLIVMLLVFFSYSKNGYSCSISRL